MRADLSSIRRSLQAGGQTVGPGADCSRPKADNDITGTGLFAHQPFKIIFRGDGPGMAMAMADQACDQIVARSARNGGFACGINL